MSFQELNSATDKNISMAWQDYRTGQCRVSYAGMTTLLVFIVQIISPDTYFYIISGLYAAARKPGPSCSKHNELIKRSTC